MMIDNADHISVANIGRCLGNIAEVNQCNVFACGIGNFFRGRKPEFFEYNFALRIQVLGRNLHTCFCISTCSIQEIGISNSSGDRIGVRVGMTNNTNWHKFILLQILF